MQNEDIRLEEEETFADKFISFMKNNVLSIVLFLSCFIFIFKDIIQIKESGKSIFEIVANGMMSFVMSFMIDIILSKKGIVAGLKAKIFIATMNRYGEEMEKTDPYIDKLDDFCDKKNDERIRRCQKNILRKERIKLDDFENKSKEEVCKYDKKNKKGVIVTVWDKGKKKAWKEALKVNINPLTSDYLLSEVSTDYDKGKKEKTLKEEEKGHFIAKIGTKVILAFISGYFVTSFVLDNWAGLIWGAIQVSIWLVLGMISYYQRYLFITQEYRQKMIRKTNYLIEFNTINNKERGN